MGPRVRYHACFLSRPNLSPNPTTPTLPYYQGSVVAVSPAVQHRLEHLFQAADTFDPDR